MEEINQTPDVVTATPEQPDVSSVNEEQEAVAVVTEPAVVVEKVELADVGNEEQEPAVVVTEPVAVVEEVELADVGNEEQEAVVVVEEVELVDIGIEDHPDAPPEIEGGMISTTIRYTLRLTGAPSLAQLVSVAVAAAVYIVLSWLAIIALPSPVASVSSIFLAIGFGIPFAIWFGGWGFVIAYLGNFIGAGLLTGMPLPFALWFGTTDLIQLGLPMLLYRLLARRFGVDPIGKDVYTVRGFIFFVLCAVLPSNIIGGLYGNFILVQIGFSTPSTYWLGTFTWVISNVVVTLIVGSILLRFLGPVVERFGLTVRNFLS